MLGVHHTSAYVTKYNEKPLHTPSTGHPQATLVHMDAIYWALAASAGAGAIGVARLATALSRRHRRRQALEVPASVNDPTRGRPRPWIIMNPSKHEDPQAFKDLINRKAKELGIDHVHWRETTREDPGTGQAVRALEEGASVVIAAGGDGTVRAVAAGMAGSGVRMGIIPVGTGNVLAGNLSIPDDPAHALTVALDRNHRAAAPVLGAQPTVPSGGQSAAALASVASRIDTPVTLVWQRMRRGIHHEAVLNHDGVITLSNGMQFRDPSAAANAAQHTQDIDGWRVWRVGAQGPALRDFIKD